jgi:hypothetical protein
MAHEPLWNELSSKLSNQIWASPTNVNISSYFANPKSSGFFGTVCTKTIIQLNHKVMGSLGLMSCGSRNLIHTTGAVLSMKYGFCEDLEDSNI